MKLLFFSVLMFIALSIDCAYSAIRIPNNLSQADREQVVRILGWGTSSKILSDPYPLGGYPGLEIGLSVESIPVEDLGQLGNKSDPQQDFTYPKISIGKGLYNNIDTWVHFIPFTETTGLSEYGALLRWCFYQARFFPGTFSLLLHGNSANITHAFTAQSIGADLITGINISNISLFLGAGKVVSTGRFLGGTHGYTDTNKDETITVDGFHSVIGGSVRFQSLFSVLQIDLYSQPVFSFKIGVRY